SEIGSVQMCLCSCLFVIFRKWFGPIVSYSSCSLTVPIPPKAGQCPLLLNVVPSHKGCVRDEDCPKDDKCCIFDSDALCVPPDFTKPGVCPRRRWGVGTCAELCSNDSDCPNDEKCCHNGCGHDCIAPYTGRIWSQSDRYTHPLPSLLLHFSGNKKDGGGNVHFIHIDQYISLTLSIELRHSIKKSQNIKTSMARVSVG
uniref:WAP domain-containing protein n=1 Tax=Oncorhynchus kisutch TaxID=8019 RepID=A0A8C7HUD6_ONCKI